MKTTITAAAIAAIALPAFAYAPHSYTYLEAAYWDQTEDAGSSINGNSDIESDGYSVAGSYRFDAGVVLQAYYAEGEVDEMFGYSLSSLGIDMDLQTFGVFVGGAGVGETNGVGVIVGSGVAVPGVPISATSVGS